jgi:ribosomal protein L21E
MALLVKPIKNGTDVVALGELAPGDVAELADGGLRFNDGTVQTTAAISGVSSVTAGTGIIVTPAAGTGDVTVEIDPAALPAVPVTSVFTRTGAIVAAAGDYSAVQVTLDPTNITGVDATDVQVGMEQLGALISAAAGGLVFIATLGFNDADPAAPAAGGPSHYYIFKDGGVRTVGDAAGVTVQVGDWLVYSFSQAKWVHLDYAARTVDATQVNYDAGPSNVILTGTTVDAALDQADVALVAIDDRLDAIESAAKVDSFKGRTGVVVPVAGDYTAAMTTFAPTADILATDVQAAIVEVGARSIPFFDASGTSRPIPLV